MLADRTFVPLLLGNLLGLASVVAYSATPDAPPPPPSPSLSPSLSPSSPHTPHVLAGPELPDPPTLDPARHAFVIDIDGEPYVQLATLSDPAVLPHHGRIRAAKSEAQPDQTIVYAPVARGDVPAPWRGWLGRQLVVDGSCRARVDGFALRAGISGDYIPTPTAMIDSDHPALVAHLDGCRGGRAARDAALPAPVAGRVELATPDAAALATLATADTLASETGRADQALYRENARRDGSSAEQIAIATAIVVHPATGARYVIVQATLASEVCDGEAGFELLGVYRDAGNGDLTRLYVGAGALDLTQPLLDLDGDGLLETVGERDVVSLRGATVAHREGDDWNGCPC